MNIRNSHHQDIQFTSVKEEGEQLAFLDVLIKRKAKPFVTTMYRKPTYTGLLAKWESFVPRQYKRSAISSMVYRGIRICSTFALMHEEFNFIRKVHGKAKAEIKSRTNSRRNTRSQERQQQ
ncbi:unnamed protein product [Rotaria magnacalcarata]|uniref:Helix-turn-helix domain-containing protein n=1 Tax=Rotaria magnacalcarata TaxID=392030 RepID=A0A815ZMP4_9BILA|nr:unnamed protein product [Rotaria magnacalcarata]CAF1586748.1 unnamed protein product [Rotaria magnacalcarata]CAF4483598.1 unnamed protein product [Rotaria magnacalcarata]CAF5089295.1 unnamed protein product [Rotaria magnacalcarata]